MARCEQCGNEYDKSFLVIMGNEEYYFDCFECAIQKLAPPCAHCGCKIIGHGIEGGEDIYCCAHCAKQSGVKGVADRSQSMSSHWTRM